MTSELKDFDRLPITPPGELCYECLALLLSYLKLLPKPQSLFALVDLMKMAQEMKHGECHPMIERLFNEAKSGSR